MPSALKPRALLLFLLSVGPTAAAGMPLESGGVGGSSAAEVPSGLVVQEATEAPSQGSAASPVPGLEEPIQAHPEGNAAINQLRSPFCPGLMLEVCPTTQAKLLRDSLQMMAWEGAPADSIVSWMLASYGEQYRGVPQASGGGLFAWLMPPLALLAGLVLVSLFLKRLRRTREASPRPVQPLSTEDESVLEAALQELEASEEVSF